MIAFGEESGAGRLEFAHVQYYGWAFANRERLLPTREQVDRSISCCSKRKRGCAARFAWNTWSRITTRNIPRLAWADGGAS